MLIDGTTLTVESKSFTAVLDGARVKSLVDTRTGAEFVRPGGFRVRFQGQSFFSLYCPIDAVTQSLQSASFGVGYSANIHAYVRRPTHPEALADPSVPCHAIRMRQPVLV